MIVRLCLADDRVQSSCYHPLRPRVLGLLVQLTHRASASCMRVLAYSLQLLPRLWFTHVRRTDDTFDTRNGVVHQKPRTQRNVILQQCLTAHIEISDKDWVLGDIGYQSGDTTRDSTSAQDHAVLQCHNGAEQSYCEVLSCQHAHYFVRAALSTTLKLESATI